jgi:bacterioferritin-associated ferredoxin
MFVCVCHALTDRQIRQQAVAACSLSELYRSLGIRPECGKCVPCVRTILTNARPAQAELQQASQE